MRHRGAAARRLQVDQAGANGVEDYREAADLFVHARIEQAEQQAVQRSGVPVAVHVAFAQAQRTEREQTGEHPIIVHLHVPWTRTVDPHIGLAKQAFHAVPEWTCVVMVERGMSNSHGAGSRLPGLVFLRP